MNPNYLKTKIWEIGNPIEYSREVYIRRVYNVLLRRDPDKNGLDFYSQVADPLQIIDGVMRSEEFMQSSANNSYSFSGRRDWGCRILLFGAYGNGNLGDVIQAASLLRIIEDIYPGAEVWACSQLPGAYPFCFSQVLPPSAIHDANVVNQFDVLIVGGGGLFSHPHPPLNVKEWQEKIAIPVIILGVGADESVIAENSTIVKKAIYVSGRDQSSVRALKQIRDDVSLIADPVLADRNYLASTYRKRNEAVPRLGRLWILKNHGEQTKALVKQIDLNTDRVCFLEPSLDYWLITIFPHAIPIYSITELLPLIDAAEMVVSMRYHGCILAMLRGKNVIGIHEDKIRQLLERFGNGNFFHRNCFEFSLNDIASYANFRPLLVKDQKHFRDSLLDVLENTLSNRKTATKL